jgi:hypothetical protein
MGFLASNNEGYRYLINAIDSFSKYAYTVLFRQKMQSFCLGLSIHTGQDWQQQKAACVADGQWKGFCLCQVLQAPTQRWHRDDDVRESRREIYHRGSF